ncbi:MAG TPA: ribosome small subunit-dependent GTPase A [Burkholderiales bacterium]|nr:ribosome small subunit-dependent GTPase A [Burkholderiales bacterium]
MPSLLDQPSSLLPGRVVAAHGRHYLVELADGSEIACFPRGKKSLIACGDRVAVLSTAKGQGVIEAVDPRRSLLYRSDQHREKLIAANVTQMIAVLAAVPSFYEELLIRCLAAAEHQGIRALIVLNKFDLVEESARARAALEPYRALGYEVLPLIAKREVAPLRAHLQGHTSVLVGQSGMGKSTIVNALVPGAAAAVSDISAALDSGRHTTTHARLYRLDAHSALIDSPGLQEFGLGHVPLRELDRTFVEFRPLLGSCRFNDCLHRGEPDCAVAAAAERGEIRSQRLTVYRRLVEEAQRARRS